MNQMIKDLNLKYFSKMLYLRILSFIKSSDLTTILKFEEWNKMKMNFVKFIRNSLKNSKMIFLQKIL